MKFNRRNTLIGLGSLVAGSGALIGTGAFSSVEADRQVTVNTTGDGDALLALSLDTSYQGITDSGGSGTNGETTIGITLDKINDDAVTTFNEALTITNNGGNSVSLTIDDNSLDGVTFTLNTSSLDATGGSTTSATADIEVDTTGTVSGGAVTITATDNS
jgi:hypothetical protein